jgi:hypothetical protein
MDESQLEKVIKKSIGKNKITVEQARYDINQAIQAGIKSKQNSSENYANFHNLSGEFKGLYAVDLKGFNRAKGSRGRGDIRLGMTGDGQAKYVFEHTNKGGYRALYKFK